MAWVRERSIPTQQPPIGGQLVPTFADKERHVVGADIHYGRNLSFLAHKLSSLSAVQRRVNLPRVNMLSHAEICLCSVVATVSRSQ
jgi:hypothetical protein